LASKEAHSGLQTRQGEFRTGQGYGYELYGARVRVPLYVVVG